jgi:hypothetical protein
MPEPQGGAGGRQLLDGTGRSRHARVALRRVAARHRPQSERRLGWRDIETPCASLSTRSPSQPRGKPGFSTLETGCGRETDSPLEGDGFELPVPRAIRLRFGDFALARPSVISTDGSRRGRPCSAHGTGSSNPFPSSSESRANLTFGTHHSPIRFRDPLSEGFRHFVTSMPAPVASGWSDRRVGVAPTGKAPPCHGARGKRSLAVH